MTVMMCDHRKGTSAMFAHTPPRAVLPARALKHIFAVPGDQPDRFADLLARLAQGETPPSAEA